MTSAHPVERAEGLAAFEAEEGGARPAFDKDAPIILSSGVRLRFRPVPPAAVRRVAIQYPEPEVPVQYIEEKGREERNPMHPDYLKAQAEREEALRLAYFDLALLVSVQIEAVPDGFPGPESDEWIEQLEATDAIEIPKENASRRRLSWLKLYAAAQPEDLMRMSYAAMAHAGILETEVSRAVASFLGIPQRGADHGTPVEQRAQNGDRV